MFDQQKEDSKFKNRVVIPTTLCNCTGVLVRTMSTRSKYTTAKTQNTHTKKRKQIIKTTYNIMLMLQ